MSNRADLSLLKVFCLFLLVNILEAIMLKQDCPMDEWHRSCWFYEEYTCWEDDSKMSRVNNLPRRLLHCIAGCYCKNGYVRAYPKGPCMQAPYCWDIQLRYFLNKLPALEMA